MSEIQQRRRLPAYVNLPEPTLVGVKQKMQPEATDPRQ